MSDTEIILLVIGFSILLVAIVTYLVMRKEKKRSALLSKVAPSLGMEFKGSYKAKEFAELYNDLEDNFGFFGNWNAQFLNLMMGKKDGLETMIFDRYVVRHRYAEKFQVLLVRSPELDFPEFVFPSKLLGPYISPLPLKKDGLVFRDLEEINKGNGNSVSELYIDESIYNELDSFFKSHGEYRMEASGNKFIFYAENKRYKPEEMKAFLDDGMKVFNLIKDVRFKVPVKDSAKH